MWAVHWLHRSNRRWPVKSRHRSCPCSRKLDLLACLLPALAIVVCKGQPDLTLHAMALLM